MIKKNIREEPEKPPCDNCGKESQDLAWSLDEYNHLCRRCRDDLAYTKKEKEAIKKFVPAKMIILPYLEGKGPNNKAMPKRMR